MSYRLILNQNIDVKNKPPTIIDIGTRGVNSTLIKMSIPSLHPPLSLKQKTIKSSAPIAPAKNTMPYVKGYGLTREN